MKLITLSKNLIKAIDNNKTDMWETSLEESHSVVKIDEIKQHVDKLKDVLEKISEEK